MISERLLRKWRGESLRQKTSLSENAIHNVVDHSTEEDKSASLINIIQREQELDQRILVLTQELLDQYLMKRL